MLERSLNYYDGAVLWNTGHGFKYKIECGRFKNTFYWAAGPATWSRSHPLDDR